MRFVVQGGGLAPCFLSSLLLQKQFQITGSEAEPKESELASSRSSGESNYSYLKYTQPQATGCCERNRERETSPAIGRMCLECATCSNHALVCGRRKACTEPEGRPRLKPHGSFGVFQVTLGCHTPGQSIMPAADGPLLRYRLW